MFLVFESIEFEFLDLSIIDVVRSREFLSLAPGRFYFLIAIQCRLRVSVNQLKLAFGRSVAKRKAHIGSKNTLIPVSWACLWQRQIWTWGRLIPEPVVLFAKSKTMILTEIRTQCLATHTYPQWAWNFTYTCNTLFRPGPGCCSGRKHTRFCKSAQRYP